MKARFKIVYGGVHPAEVTRRIVRNPNYGGLPCDVPGCCTTPIVERAMKPKFFDALIESVRREGFRNPIILVRTTQGYLLQFGGSRLRVAKRLCLRDIPAIIVDYVGDVRGTEITPSNYEDFFIDIPQHFEFTEYGVDHHYSLERARRHTHDPAGFDWTPLDAEFIKEEFPWVT